MVARAGRLVLTNDREMQGRRATIKAHSAHHPPDGVPIHSPLAPTEMKH
jgi:hypothetical protein